MSYKVEKAKISDKLKKLDNQCLDSFDPLPKRTGLLYLLVGKKGASKSTTMLNILKTKNKDGGYKGFFKNIIFVSPTAMKDKKLDKLRESCEEDNNYYSDFSNVIMMDIMQKCAAYAEEYGDDDSTLLILDDCLALLPRSMKDNKFHQFVTTMRHLKCCCWVMLQFLKSVSPLVRANTDMISMYRSDSESEIESFLESFGVPRDVYEYCTREPYSFCHVTFTSGSPLYFKKYDLLKRVSE